MIDLSPHKKWIVVLTAAFFLWIGGGPVLGVAQRKVEERRVLLHREKQKTGEAFAQLKQDIAEAENARSEIDLVTARKYLAPVERLLISGLLDDLAAHVRMTEVSSILAPEKKAFFDTIGAGKVELALSPWELVAKAPTDTAVYIFLDSVEKTLPGRFVLRRLSLERLGGRDSVISGAGIRVSASGEWLSNGAAQNWGRE